MPNQGLSSAEVKIRLQKFGYNEIPSPKEFRALKILLSQFTSFLIIILVIAGSVSYALDEKIDAIAIFVIVIVNALIGFSQEYKAENAVAALKKLVIPTALVIRNSREIQIDMRQLVPDDIVIISEGDKIPADMKIIEGFSLKVDQAVLTGESIPVNKKNGDPLFKGTIINTGRCRAIVTGTGANTEFGKIVTLLSKQTKTRSPLTIQLDELGKKLGIFILSLVGIVFVLGELRSIPILNMFMTSVALGVSAIPEGMPIIVTLTLAVGVQILAKKKAIVRKMNAIETLGATTIICSDKTGTLTMNEMTVKKINTNFQEHAIPGTGYSWKETIKISGPEEKKLMEICENNNNSFVENNIIGDPTEIALRVLARKARYVKNFKKLDENVFTSERKMMSSLHKVGQTKEIFAKGAFEEIIKKCSHIYKNGKVVKISPADKKTYQQIADSYSKEALRVLAFAFKPYKNKFDEENLAFLGLTAMMDPPRKSVPESIKIATEAGIKVKIITGDNPITAQAIGKKIGLNSQKVVIGEELDKMSDKELLRVINETDIFARTSPEHKYRIVNILKKSGEVVAVTGDGVNDAPALKHADVGIAMGIKGTEATKEVADIVLKDDNFTTIINTIHEGRRIYQNILAFIKYMISANFNTIAIVGILTLLGFPLPILALQVLWINIATDGLPALALGTSAADPGIMKSPPHSKHENIFKKFFSFIIIAAILQTILDLLIYFYGYEIDVVQNGLNLQDLNVASKARTMVFTETVLFELVFVFVCKEEKNITMKSLFSNKSLIFAVLSSFILQLLMVYLPSMQKIFHTSSLNLQEWITITFCALSAFLVPPINNWYKKHFDKKAKRAIVGG